MLKATFEYGAYAFVSLAAVLSCLAGCSAQSAGEEKKAVFLAYQEAAAAGDIESIRTMLSAHAIREMERSGMDLEAAVELAQSMTPAVVTVVEPLPARDSEDLQLDGEGTELGHTTGTVTFAREDGSWKIDKIEWRMDMSVGRDDPVFGDVRSPWDPDYRFRLTGLRANAPRLGRIDRQYLKAKDEIRQIAPKPFMKGKRYTPRPTRTLTRVDAEFDNLIFTPDGRYLITASYNDYFVRIWDASMWTELENFKMETRPTSLAASPRGDRFVTGDVYSHISVWSLEDGRVTTPAEKEASAGRHLSVAVSGNDRLIATVSWDKVLTIWSLDRMEMLTRVNTDFRFRCVAISPAGPVLAAGTTTNMFALWDLRTGKGRMLTVPKADKQSEVVSISFSPDGKRLVTGHSDSSISVWNVETQKELHNFCVRDASTSAVAFSPGGDVFATGQANSFIYIWETETAQLLATLKGHDGGVRDLAFSPDGTMLASTGEDNTIVIWE